MNAAIRALLAFLIIASTAGPARNIAAAGRAQRGDLDALLDKIMERVDSYPELKNWKASVTSVEIEMDKNWRPKKSTRIIKIVTVADEKRTEEIREALETEKGVTKDLTKKLVQEAEKRRREAGKKAAERRQESGDQEKKQGLSLTLSTDDLIPFREKIRQNYTFARLPDEELEGRLVSKIESRAKTRDDESWEGRYWIDPDTFDVLKVSLTLAKNPKFVKEIAAEVQFQVLPAGYFVPRRSRMKVDAGMIIKHIRMVVEEEYSEYEIIESETVF